MLGISLRSQYKIFLAIKQRFKKYGKVGFSRLENSRFGVSERRLQSFINMMIDKRHFVIVGMVKSNKNAFKCNVYKLSKEFSEYLEKVREYVKKEFVYQEYTPDDVINYVSSFAKKKYRQWKIEIKGNLYIIADSGYWRGKIYSCNENKCISLITLQKLYA